MKNNSRLVIMIISLILVAQLIFAYSKANNERSQENKELQVKQETNGRKL